MYQDYPMTWWKNLFIAAYLIIQMTLPLRGCLYDKFENPGYFSWNMYTTSYECGTQYRLDTPAGETRWLRYEDYFNRPEYYTRVLYSDVLPKFHHWLCDEFRRQGELKTLRGYAICSLNRGPDMELVDRTVDLCTAPNYGVKAQREAFER